MTKIYKFLLIFFSIINLAKVKFLGINKANYFIINNKNLIDKRSLCFFNLKDCKQTFNLVRISNLNFKIMEKDNPVDLLKKIKPDFHCKGGDYKKENLIEYNFLKKRHIKMFMIENKQN